MFFLTPRRILKVRPEMDVRPGDTVTPQGDGPYLVTENGDANVFGRIIHKTFKIFHVTDEAIDISRISGTDDPITGMKNNSLSSVGATDAVIEYDKQREDEMRVGADQMRIITPVQLMPKDVIGGLYTIVNCEPQLGVWFSIASKA